MNLNLRPGEKQNTEVGKKQRVRLRTKGENDVATITRHTTNRIRIPIFTSAFLARIVETARKINAPK